jgi:hypothetical protein
MQTRWEGWLNRAAEESRALREHRQAQASGRGDVERQMADRAGAERTGPRPMAQESMSGSRGGQGTYRSGNAPGEETQQFRRPGG